MKANKFLLSLSLSIMVSMSTICCDPMEQKDETVTNDKLLRGGGGIEVSGGRGLQSTTTTTVLSSTFASSSEGYIYSPDMFYGTLAGGTYARGSYQGGTKQRLRLVLGGVDDKLAVHLTGGFKKSFTLESDATDVEFQFLYKINFPTAFDKGENVQVLCKFDDTKYFVLQYTATDDATDNYYKGNRLHKLNLGPQPAGVHSISVGGYLSKKDDRTEKASLFFDNINVSAVLGGSKDPLSMAKWQTMSYTGKIKTRHEACFVMVGAKAYLIGGRGNKQVDIYDPSTKSWSAGSKPEYQLHHMQCVAVGNQYVYIVSAWNGAYPNEKNVDVVWVYDTKADNWFTRTALPEHRRRGGAAAVLVGNEIYVMHGNRGGHGEHATSLPWTDKYNVLTDTWTTNLADAPNARDHAGGSLMADGKICVAGGRDGGSGNFFNNVVLPTDCYDPATDSWTTRANIPQGRAGSAYGQTCDGKLMVAGGEGNGVAYDRVDVFDGKSWKTIDNLERARHGTGLAVSCNSKQIHIVSGSGAQGGRPELSLLETLDFS